MRDRMSQIWGIENSYKNTFPTEATPFRLFFLKIRSQISEKLLKCYAIHGIIGI